MATAPNCMSKPRNAIRPLPDSLNRRIQTIISSTSRVSQVQKYIPRSRSLGSPLPVSTYSLTRYASGMLASMAKTVNPISAARNSVIRCFIWKNSRVPCVPSPRATIRASPMTALSGWRSANPWPASAVSNGITAVRSHFACLSFSGRLSTAAAGPVWTPIPSSKPRLTGSAELNIPGDSEGCSPSIVFVDATSLPTTSIRQSSSQAWPLPATSIPNTTACALSATSRTISARVQSVVPLIRRASMLSNASMAWAPSMRIHRAAPSAASRVLMNAESRTRFPR